MDQIFAITMLVEKYLGKDRKFHVAFIDFEKIILGLIGKHSGMY